MDDDLLTIGRFARLTGLTVNALRHYDAEGILVPAHVDRDTAYRRYRRDQAQTARAVAALRELDLSLPAIRALLQADEADDRAAILADERRRLEARTARLQRALHRLSMLSMSASASASASAATSPAAPSPAPVPAPASPTPHPEELSVPTPKMPPALDPELERSLAAGLYNRSWDLLEIEHRTPAQDDELIDTAHASAHHWRNVGNAANEARGHWMLARVYSVLSRGSQAVYHARRANEVVEAGGEGFADWDAPGAAEAMARALAVSGDLDGAREWKARAQVLLEAVADPEDRGVIEGDLATLPV